MSDDFPARIGDVLRDLPGRSGIDAPLETAKVWTCWVEIVGPEIAEHAEPTSLKGGVLRVRAESPAWATEIGYLAEEIRARANTALDSAFVSEVRVWTGPGAMSRRRSNGAGNGVPKAAERPRSNGPKDDPQTVFRRVRAAWLRGRKGRPPEPS